MEKNSGGRFWMILAITFLATSIALSAYLVYVKEFEDDKDSDNSDNSDNLDNSDLTLNETVILAKYPTFFRTEEQQRYVETIYIETTRNNEKAEVPIDFRYTSRNCTSSFCDIFVTRPENAGRQKRSPESFTTPGFFTHPPELIPQRLFKRQTQGTAIEAFHGCCISSPAFTSPPTAETPSGKQVTVVHFPGNTQYFPSDRCRRASECDSCTCLQETALFSAIVLIDHDNDNSTDELIRVELIKVPGCCKCFNSVNP